MKKAIYKEMSQTAKGRYELHTLLLQDIKERMDQLKANAPSQNKGKIETIFNDCFDKIQTWGNGDLFLYLADEDVSTRNFLLYLMDINSNKL